MELSPMSKLLRSFQALALLELIAFAGVAMAQQDGSWCAPAEASLRSSARGDTYHRAIRDLVGCPVSGPQALAAQWAHPPEDTVALQILGDASATLRDRRLPSDQDEVIRKISDYLVGRLPSFQGPK